MDRGYIWLAVYALTGALYVALGVFFPRFLLSWVEGATFLLLGIVLLSTLFRLRR
jgi:hypothetical protein